MNTSLWLSNPVWIGWLLWAVVGLIVSLYLPGSLLVSRLKLKSTSMHFVLAWAVGLALWAAQGVLLGYFQLRWLTFGYIVLALVGTWFQRETELQRHRELWSSLRRMSKLTWLMVVVGTLVQVLPVIGTGWQFADGVHFYRINAYDGVMHLAYVQELVHHFPPAEPGAYWLPLVNYHYWSDVAMAELSRVWQLPITHVVFQIAPLGLSLVTAAATYQFLRQVSGRASTGQWGLLFLYGAGELTYLFMWYFQRRLGFDITPAIDNGAMQFLNLPHCFAKAIFMSGLLTLSAAWSEGAKNKWWWLISLVLLSTLVGFKIYFGMFVALGLVLALAGYGLQQGHVLKWQLPKLWKMVWWPGVSVALIGLVMMAIFFPVNHGAGGLFYSPLEWPKLFLGHTNLNWQGWWLRRQVYEAAGNTRNLIIMDSLAIAICLLSIHGTRLLGLWPRRWWLKLGWPMFLFLSGPTLIFTWLGLFTLQESGLFNVFNFFAVSTIPLALATAWVCDEWWSSKRWWLKTFVVIVVMLSIPRAVHTSYFYLDTYRNSKVEQVVSPDELAAFRFIETQLPAASVVQSSPLNTWDKTSPYVAYYSQRPAYLSGVGMMDTHNQPVSDPYAEYKKMFMEVDGVTLRSYLQDRAVTHVYLRKKADELPSYPPSELGSVVFENDSVMLVAL